MTRNRCKYCKNAVRRNVHNPNNGENEDVCEVHYAYLKPRNAQINPLNIDRCIRCGERSLNRRNDDDRLIDHHVNYYLDLTVPVCDSCHREIHAEVPDDAYLEATERTDEPFAPRGTRHHTGIAIHRDYRTDGGRSKVAFDCPDCGTGLIHPPSDMGFDKPLLCDNSDCQTTSLTTLEAE